MGRNGEMFLALRFSDSPFLRFVLQAACAGVVSGRRCGITSSANNRIDKRRAVNLFVCGSL